ncbi:glycosyltransferase involved in cell wall biosynthesis [Motilibacter peucedani]|uniref:Glycosyltransferase involved in cell wall biosynthesis n=1 Tax=Motilibacter peucedani TaxID=598650 RepID=A0A420XMC5_9ACTN|nr:glycosyltransferase [Motilibacter peucedani]RKS71478.1 glycosyltransferase involved in cell wall biosynthesis [Motilibacter peucedani]
MGFGARAPHVLYVAWGYPPCRSGGTYRALATANAFARDGWDVTVLTCEREVFERYTGVDTSLEPLVDPRIRVERVPFEWPALEPDLRSWSLLRAVSPPAWAKLRRSLDQRSFPEPAYGPWRPVLEAAAERIHAEHPVDLCVATANPHVDYTAPLRLHERHGVPFVADYRDAWSFDVFTGAVLHTPDSRQGRWEARVLEGAAEVWFVNEPIRARQAAEHPALADKLHVVANGYDLELAAEGVARRPSPDDGLVFGYIGTISRQVPVTELVEGWQVGRERSELLARSTVALHGYIGHNAPLPAVEAAVAAGASVGVDYRGPVPKAQVESVYEGFDALLLVLGTGTYVTSGKVYEYLATGLPIVSVHDPANAASEVVRGYPLWFPAASLAPDDVAAALAAAAEAAVGASEETRAACVAYARQFRREAQLAPRVSALRELVTQGAAPADGAVSA